MSKYCYKKDKLIKLTTIDIWKNKQEIMDIHNKFYFISLISVWSYFCRNINFYKCFANVVSPKYL
jgi:hypothetical protein